MLSYFVLRRSLRGTAQFRGDVPGIIVIIVDKDWVGRFHRAGELLLSGQRHAFFNAETSRHQVVSIETRSKKGLELDILRYSAQTIVVTDSFDVLPDKVRIAADEILYVDNPTPRHINAVRKLSGRRVIANEMARQLANQKWDIIDALLCRDSLDGSIIEAAAPNPSSAAPRLSELPGFGSVRSWALELSQDLSAWRRGELEWFNLDRAALLIGPPGVGKTMCAGALAAELDLEFIATSAGQWQSAGGGHLGDMLKAMRLDFEKASKCRRGCLLFIDELDSIGSRTHQSQHAYYETQVVNTFLELTSRVVPGVVLLAATNRIEDIEPAILRSGRFERHIMIDLPTPQERAEMLSYHIKGFDAARLRRWTDQLPDFTPADLERLGRSIRRSARAAGREVDDSDVEAGMPSRVLVSEGELRRFALHECGHAVAALDCDFIKSVTIELFGAIIEGRGVQSGGHVKYDMKDSLVLTEEVLRTHIRISLAGLAAEDLELGSKSTGAGGNEGSDLETATNIAALMVASWGMGKIPRLYAARKVVERKFRPAGPISDEIDAILLAEWGNVKALLQRERGKLLELTSELLHRKRITLDETGRSVQSGGSLASTIAEQCPPARQTSQG